MYERSESQEEEARGSSDWDVGLTSVEEQEKEKDGLANVSPESLLEKVSHLQARAELASGPGT